MRRCSVHRAEVLAFPSSYTRSRHSNLGSAGAWVWRGVRLRPMPVREVVAFSPSKFTNYPGLAPRQPVGKQVRRHPVPLSRPLGAKDGYGMRLGPPPQPRSLRWLWFTLAWVIGGMFCVVLGLIV